jgi:hypothetical protein
MIHILEEIDHVANRVGMCALTGFFGGAAYATFKGFPRRATSLKAAASCAIVATSLFGTERIANILLRHQIHNNEYQLTLSSYAFAGVVGGGLNGYLYQKKPLRGMFYFIPLSLCIGMIELDWTKRKEERIRELQDDKVGEDEDDGA